MSNFITSTEEAESEAEDDDDDEKATIDASIKQRISQLPKIKVISVLVKTFFFTLFLHVCVCNIRIHLIYEFVACFSYEMWKHTVIEEYLCFLDPVREGKGSTVCILEHY